MSIISNTDNYSTKSRVSSVYQTNGKPLSKEALYKAKLKYGIYDSPSAKSLGVPNGASASDTAALLANSTDLTIEPYQRTVAADAHTAALQAKKDTAPQRWTRESISEDAASAALHAKSFSARANEVPESHTDTLSSASAASALYNKTGKSIGSLASSNLASLYEFDAVRNGQRKSTLDISKINQVSKERATTMLSNRMNPEKDASRFGLPTQSKQDKATLESFAAVGALASQNYKAPVDPDLEAKAIYRNSLIDPKVLAAASLNASKTLQGIDKKLGEKDFMLNPEFNKAALAIAQRHHEKRAVNSEKVNLGGGLFMTQEELDAIATKFVSPVLEQIDKTATAQRKKDAELAKQKAAQKKAHEDFKAAQRAKKLEEQKLKAEAKAKRRAELEEEKKKEKEAKLALEKAKKEELEKHKQILASKQKEEIRKKDELLAKKNIESERISKEATEAEALRKSELEAAEKERTEKLAPILANLKIEQDKLDILNEEKKAIQDIAESQAKNTENANSLLVASKLELSNAEDVLKQLQLDIENTSSEQERLAKEAELKKAEVEVTLKKTNELAAEAALKQAEIDEEKAIVENERLKIELELENEKISALEEEKKIAELLPPSVQEEEEEEPVVEAKTEAAPAAESKAVETSTTSGTSDPLLASLAAKAKGTASSGSISGSGTRYRSMVDDALNYDPRTDPRKSLTNAPTSAPAVPATTTGTAATEEVDGGELKQTFSGFSQGSADEKEINDESASPDSVTKDDKHTSIFKEEF